MTTTVTPFSPTTTTTILLNNNTVPFYDDSMMTLEEYEEFLKVEDIFNTAMAINRYYLWPLFILGFPGNCAAIITIFRMRSCIGTFPVFVVMLAVMDSLAILVKLLFYQLLDHKVDLGGLGCGLLR
ncbi:hypothetical protein ACOMHN_066305 [Nucella lapillus]